MIAGIFLWGVLFVAGEPGVAPDDFDPICDQHASPDGATEKVLLDTQRYTSQSLITIQGDSGKWLSLDLDDAAASNGEWADHSQSLTCKHNVIVCGCLTAPQSNWMVTQYINISRTGISELVLNISFFPMEDVGTTCIESLGIRMYPTNSLDEDGRTDPDRYSSNLAPIVHTQGGETQKLISHQIPINSSYTGLYLAVVDPPPGNCVSILRIALYYHVCPERVLNLVKYPEVIAPTLVNIDDIPVPAVCSENAVLTSLVKSVECKYRGRWDSNNVVCECIEGYFFDNSSDSCQVCSQGYYKMGIGNLASCILCPKNSRTESPAASECRCESGFYRTPSEPVTEPCTAPPSPPRNLVVTDITFSNVTLSWDPPADNGGRPEVTYTLMYNGVVISDVTSTQYVLTDLFPYTHYTVFVIALNDVSSQDASPADSTTKTTFITDKVPPNIRTSNPASIDLMIGWEKPAVIYGRIVTYQLLVATTNDSSQATVYNTTHSSYNLSCLNLHPGVYHIWSRAVTTTGIGELSNPISYSAGSGMAESVTAAAMIPAILGMMLGVVIMVLAAVLIAIGISYYKKRKCTYNIKQAEQNTFQINHISHHEEL